MVRKHIISLVAAFVVASSLSTASYGATLNEYIDEVLQTNPKVLAKLKYYNSIVYSSRAIRSRNHLTVDVDATAGKELISNSNTKYHDKSDEFSGARVTARKLLSDGNRLHYDVKAMESNAKSALFSYVDTANSVAYETAEAYINILKYRELMALAIENVDIHTRLMQNIKARVEAETSGKSELERVQGRLAMAQSTYIARQNDYKRAVYQFHKLLGRFVDGSDFKMPFVSGTLIPKSLREAIQKQWECNPNLIALDYNIAVQEYDFLKERAANRPDLYFEAIKDWHKNKNGLKAEENDEIYQFRITLPLYDAHESRHKRNHYRSLIHHEKYNRDNVARTILNDLNLIYTGYKQLETQIGAMRKSLFFTKRALRSYQQEFKLGKRLLINILDAEVEYQNARAQLATLRADLLISKFRLLYSMGGIVEDLGLEIPYAKDLAELRKVRPATVDKLPYIKDFDYDGIADKLDVSINSLRGSIVNDIGETEEMTKNYLSEPIPENLNQEIKVIKDKADLQIQSIKPDVPTEIGFVTFVEGTEELSDKAKVIMREVLPQLKRIADDGNIKITVTQGDSSDGIDAELLALRRAYSLKKILTMHLFDPDTIFVESRKSVESEHNNAMVLTIVTDINNFRDNVSSTVDYSMLFKGQSVEMDNTFKTLLGGCVDRFNKLEEGNVDVIAYSNDMKNPTKDKELSLKRAQIICEEMKKMGLTKKVNPVAWGSYDSGSDLYAGDTTPIGVNLVEFVVRD